MALQIAVAPPIHAETPLLSVTTTKSLGAFESCFVGIEESRSRPSWLVTNHNSGRISNAGADGVTNPYRIRFASGVAESRVEAFIGRRDEADERPVVEALKSCI